MDAIVFSKVVPADSLRGALSKALKACGLTPLYVNSVPLDLIVGCPEAMIALDAFGFELMSQARALCPHAACGSINFQPDVSAVEPSAFIEGIYAFLLAHKLAVVGAQSAKRFVVLTGERGCAPSAELGTFLTQFAQVLASRAGKQHYRTEIEHIARFALKESTLTEMLEAIRQYSHLSCFSVYQGGKEAKYPGAEFGFLARRTPEGTLITARASSKSAPSEADLVLIRAIEPGYVVRAQSVSGKKPSLNGTLAHRIFSLRPEINWVLHTHAFLPAAKSASVLSTPGTLEDWLSIEKLILKGERLINQPLHGALVLLEKVEDLLPLLKAQNVYRFNSVLYELAYARFQERAGEGHFERAIRSLGLATDKQALDLCCGTGASTRLLRQFFTQVDFADGSASMLRIAEQALGERGILCQLPELSGLDDKKYDLITLRQAFNYVRPAERATFFSSVRRRLKPGGWLVFNTFMPKPAGMTAVLRSKLEGENSYVYTEERNEIKGDVITHSQRSEIVNFGRKLWMPFIDVNTFYQHSPEKLEQTLKTCGFKVKILISSNSVAVLAQTDALT